MNNENKVKKLNELVSDIDCLEPLYKWTNELNIFNVLKIDRVEIRHSNMLSWLLNPNELHGLGDKLLKKFLIYATNGTNLEIMKNLTPIDVDLLNLNDVVAYREQDNIDILLVSESNKIVCAIENKIGTGEHSDQLNRYRKILQDKYGESYRYVLLFLSPDGIEPSDSENWISMGYKFVLDELEKITSIYKISDKAKLYIDDYLKAIRRSVVEDKELRELCNKIYFKHKEAFDIIFENKPDINSEISTYIYNYLVENAQKFDITVWNDYSTSYVRFTPNKLVELYGNMGSEEWYHSKNLIAFEIQNFRGYDLSIKVVIGPSKPEFAEYRQLILDKAIAAGYKMKGNTLRNKWKTIKSNTLISKEKLNFENLKFVEDMVEIPLDNYLEKELPKIIEDLC